MPRKIPYSGKQKRRQLQEKKSKKQSGPKYLQNSDDEVEGKATSTGILQQSGSDSKEGSIAQSENLDAKVPDIQKINLQPHTTDSSCLDANSFRLHFFKEDVQTINKRKKEARRPIKPVSEEYREWTLEDAYPLSAKLDFPKRPPWNYTSSKTELEERENKYFQGYVQDVLDQPRAQDLSFFELNLETWRQLWRVLEMSDILLVIADIRYPVLHVPPRLLNYVMNDLKKEVIVVLNKVDLVSPVLALAWKRYLETKLPGLCVVLFSSNPREVSLENGIDPSSMLQKRPFQSKAFPVGCEQLYKTIKAIINDSVDLSTWEQLLNDGMFPDVQFDGHENPDTESPDELLSSTKTSKQRGLTIGCLGYPNAGKSSVLNALVGKKVVSVSKSPGHTKHFQTIFLTPNVRLCDCPGLVFPSMVPKSLQVLAGIFPVSQVKEPYSVVGYLAKRLDLPKLLNIQPPNSSPRKKGRGEERYLWSSFDVCEAWALKCGYTTSKAGRPDMYRAANKILRLAVEGQLCLCFFPPGFLATSEALMNDPEVDSLTRNLCGKARGRGIPQEGNLKQEDSEEEEEEEEEEGNPSDIDNKEDDLGGLGSPGMFDKLNIQDERGSSDSTGT